MGASITIENLTKAFKSSGNSGNCFHGDLLVLDRINLAVAKGEFLALLGPSGCGKSTLLHVIAGLASAKGAVSIDGRTVTGPGLDRGIVFQEYALFPWRTALGNVEFGLETKGVAKNDRTRISREYLSLVGLDGFEDRYPYQLSGGMKQRVAIARSLAYDPDVLLMDEPFAALDAQNREILQCELLKIWEKTRKTILFVTHSIDEAAFLAQKVAIITARPGTVKKIVAIPLPASRHSQADLRSSAEFTGIRHQLWELLAEEVGKAGQRPAGSKGTSATSAGKTAGLPGRLGFVHRFCSRKAADA